MAQLVERRTRNPKTRGSKPARSTRKIWVFLNKKWCADSLSVGPIPPCGWSEEAPDMTLVKTEIEIFDDSQISDLLHASDNRDTNFHAIMVTPPPIPIKPHTVFTDKGRKDIIWLTLPHLHPNNISHFEIERLWHIHKCIQRSSVTHTTSRANTYSYRCSQSQTTVELYRPEEAE